MKRLVVIILALLVLACGLYYLFNQYWIHRYDAVIVRQASTYHLDPDLVWSVIYEENHFFFPWKRGKNGEIGLMQVTPVVARDWASGTGNAGLEQRAASDPFKLLREPERNVQIGCWYLAKFNEDYRDAPGREARMLAAYNAGPSRAVEWNRVAEGAQPLTEQEFIARIDIPSTRAYVTSILERYHRIKSAKATTQTRSYGNPRGSERVTDLLKGPALSR